MFPANSELNWHADHHTAFFTLRSSEVLMETTQESCPFVIDGPCRFGPGGSCAFIWFVQTYGTEINVGTVVIDAPTIEFAWSYHGDERDIEAGQMWLMPLNDNVFGPWVQSFVEEEE